MKVFIRHGMEDPVVVGPWFDPNRHRIAAEGLQKRERVGRGSGRPSE